MDGDSRETNIDKRTERLIRIGYKVASKEPVHSAAVGFNGNTVVLYHTDCVKGMGKIGEKKVNVIVTSPPYNIGMNYSSHEDNLPRSRYLAWLGEVAFEMKRILRDDGSIFLNMGGTLRDPWIAWDVAQVFRRQFVLQNVIHWIKSISIKKKDVGDYPNIAGDIGVGHFKPIVSERFLTDCHEYIFHFTKTGEVKLKKLSVGVPYQDKSNIGRWKRAQKDLRDRGNNWFIPYETIKSKNDRPHPATFPVSLPEMCIRLHGISGRRLNFLVVDPFLGIGSTALAAMKLGVSFKGYEIDKHYIREAGNRLSNFVLPSKKEEPA